MRAIPVITALFAAIVLPVGAQAAVTVTPVGAGGTPYVSVPGLTSIATFDSIAQTPYGQTSATPAFTDGGGSWSGGGVVMENAGLDSLGLYAEPLNDTTNYMAVLGGQSETVTYNKLQSQMGLYWGSIDSYNVLTLFNGANSVTVPVPAFASGGQSSSDSNQYFVISGFAFDKAVFSSNGNSFEFDNVAVSPVATPEPGTWAMLGLGFAALGFGALRKGRTDRLAPALG
jgi:hypothetical protein